MTNSPPPDPAHAAHEHEPHKANDLGFALPPPAQISRARAIAIGAGVALVLAAAFLIRWLPARHAQRALAEDTRSALAALPRVQVVAPVVGSSDRSIALPGSVQPLEETVVYPRVGGYVKRWTKDLGETVEEGDLLAEIDTPELDQQLAQARAQLAQAEASLMQARASARFSKESLSRAQKLAAEALASQQDLEKARAQSDVDQASIGVAEANIAAHRANVAYLGQQKTFARVVAPFGGKLTERRVERGALVTAGTATPLFRVAATDPVRVFVQVPQDVAPGVRVDVPAKVSVREFPSRTFEGKIAHAAGALDAATRTMATEVRVPNPKGELLTGMYASVSLVLPNPHRVLSVPATALVNDAHGLRVALVDDANRIRYARVVLERDTGPTVEIASGLEPTDRVVRLPGVDLTEGREVEIVKAAEAPAGKK